MPNLVLWPSVSRYQWNLDLRHSTTSLSSLHALRDSSFAEVAPTLSTSSVAVAARDSRSALVMLQAVFGVVPYVVGGTRLASQISLVGPLPDPCTKLALFGVNDKLLHHVICILSYNWPVVSLIFIH